MSAYSDGATPAALCVAIALEQAQLTHTARPVVHQGCGPASGCLDVKMPSPSVVMMMSCQVGRSTKIENLSYFS